MSMSFAWDSGGGSMLGATDYSTFLNQPVFGNMSGPVISPFRVGSGGSSGDGAGVNSWVFVAAGVAVAAVVVYARKGKK